MKSIHLNEKTNQPSSASTIISGCEEVLSQALTFLESISQSDYIAVCTPHMESSIGEHFRHWLDLFHSLATAEDKVDYNIRRRGHAVERDIEVAKKEITMLNKWLCDIRGVCLNGVIQVELETLVSKTTIDEASSTLGRELSFVALHATHHFAMIKLAASMQGIKAGSSFGVAPSTASFRRAQ